MAAMDFPDLTHPAWITGFSTVFGYGLILVVLAITFFLLPYLVFLAL